MGHASYLVYGPICNKYYNFLDGNYYVAKTSCGVPVIDQWTKQPLMIKRHFEHLRVYPLQQLRRKVILYPDSIGVIIFQPLIQMDHLKFVKFKFPTFQPPKE